MPSYCSEQVIPTRFIRNYLEEICGERSREYVLVVLVATVQSMVWAMMIPVIPLLARSLGASEVQLGFISIMPAVIAVLFSLPGGALANRYGKRAAFMGCGLMSIVGGILFLSAKSLPALILPQLFNGASNVLFWPTEKTYLTDLIPEKMRATVVGYSMAITSVGSIFGPVVAGRLIDTVGFDAVFYMYIGLGVLGVIIPMPLPKTDRDMNVSILSTFTGGLSQISALWSRPIIRITTLTTFAQYINSAVTEYFLPVFMREAGFSATLIGATVTLRTTGTLVVRLLVGTMAKRLNMIILLFAALGTSAVAVGMVPVIPSASFALMASFVMGFAFGIAPVLTAAVIAKHTKPVERNIAMAFDSTSMYSSRVLTGSSIGAVAGAIGYGPAIILGNVIVMVAMVGLGAMYQRTARPRGTTLTAPGAGD